MLLFHLLKHFTLIAWCHAMTFWYLFFYFYFLHISFLLHCLIYFWCHWLHWFQITFVIDWSPFTSSCAFASPASAQLPLRFHWYFISSLLIAIFLYFEFIFIYIDAFIFIDYAFWSLILLMPLILLLPLISLYFHAIDTHCAISFRLLGLIV